MPGNPGCDDPLGDLVYGRQFAQFLVVVHLLDGTERARHLSRRGRTSYTGIFGAWLSLARAPGSGPGGRWFESTRPDHFQLVVLASFLHRVTRLWRRAFLNYFRGLEGIGTANSA